jgi:hypothetical protein
VEYKNRKNIEDVGFKHQKETLMQRVIVNMKTALLIGLILAVSVSSFS